MDIARIQDDTVGDGTTSVTVLCGELLREAEFLVNQRIHPMTIMQGWRTAVAIARQALEQVSGEQMKCFEKYFFSVRGA